MTRLLQKVFVFFLFCFTTTSFATPVNYPHLLPSPYTLPAGRLVLGSSVAFGVTDYLQIGTDVISNIFQVYNANMKIGVVRSADFAFALTGGFESYNLSDLSANNPDLSVTSYIPGMVMGYTLSENVAHFIGGSYSISKIKLKDAGLEATAFVTGIRAESDLALVYGEHSNTAIAGGVSYDFAFKMYGFGLSHHWPGFHLGFHYYPEAVRNKIYPIISGGAVVDL